MPWQEHLLDAFGNFSILLEGVAALVIAMAAIRTGAHYFSRLVNRAATHRRDIRLKFVESLVLALDFMVAADILRTAQGPTIENLLSLGGIVAIRIVLALVLGWELRSESTRVD